MKTAEGEDETSCKTGAAMFDMPEGKVKRGVISYYATKTLTDATTIESWQRLMNEAMIEDGKNGKLSKFNQKQLRVIGNGKTALPKLNVTGK